MKVVLTGEELHLAACALPSLVQSSSQLPVECPTPIAPPSPLPHMLRLTRALLRTPRLRASREISSFKAKYDAMAADRSKQGIVPKVRTRCLCGLGCHAMCSRWTRR